MGEKSIQLAKCENGNTIHALKIYFFIFPPNLGFAG